MLPSSVKIKVKERHWYSRGYVVKTEIYFTICFFVEYKTSFLDLNYTNDHFRLGCIDKQNI